MFAYSVPSFYTVSISHLVLGDVPLFVFDFVGYGSGKFNHLFSLRGNRTKTGHCGVMRDLHKEDVCHGDRVPDLLHKLAEIFKRLVETEQEEEVD